MAEPILDWKTHVTIIASTLVLGGLGAVARGYGWPLRVAVPLGAAVAAAAIAIVMRPSTAKRALWLAAAVLLATGLMFYVSSL